MAHSTRWLLLVSLVSAGTAACQGDGCPAGARRSKGRCIAPVNGGEGEDDDGGPTPADAGGDAGCEQVYYRDSDGDGFGNDAEAERTCDPPAGWVAQGGDCDDSVPATHSGAVERCNGIDDDCIGGPDSDLAFLTYYRDQDGDTWGDDGQAVSACAQLDGYVLRGGDCDDGASAVSPDATEICNGVDDDCGSGPDDTFACTLGASLACKTTCGTAGTMACLADCRLPAACTPPVEVCNYVDDDCDGLVDPGMQGLVGEPVAVSPEQDLTEPRILALEDGDGYVVGWSGLATLSLVTLDSTMNATGGPVEVVADNGAPTAWDVVVAGHVFVSGFSSNGADPSPTRSSQVTEIDERLGFVASWTLDFAGSPSVGAIQSAATAGGVVSAYVLDGTTIRVREAHSGAEALREGATDFAGGMPALAPRGDGGVLVGFVTEGDVFVAALDAQGDESSAPRALTQVGDAVRVALAHAATTTGIAIVERWPDVGSSLAVPQVSSVSFDEELAVVGEPHVVASVDDPMGQVTFTADGLATNGDEYMAVIRSSAQHVGTLAAYRLGPDGILVESWQIPLLRRSHLSAVTWGGRHWAVAYLDDSDGGNPGSRVFLQLVGCP